MNNNSYSKCSAEELTVPKRRLPENMPLAMAYVPYQSWDETYAENTALAKGTIFPSLDLPFLGREGVQTYGK